MSKTITVFEHEKLFTDKGEKISPELHLQLEKLHGDYSPFFTLVRNGVQFNSHVGVIQIGKTLIEILPKADRKSESEWRNLLIGMIQTIWGFEVKETGTSDLKIRKNSILDLYFEIFIKEIEILLHKGLIKKYRKTEGNKLALKGSLQFSKHIIHNLTHQERFYIKYSTYDVYHQLHSILSLALKLISKINTNVSLTSRINVLLLDFPEMKAINISEKIFDKIMFDRKNHHYKKSIGIAKLLLLNYHPDVSKGRNNVLSLMFDMNLLWEQFVYITLKRRLSGHSVTSQLTRNFWKPEIGKSSGMRPDIVVKNLESQQITILDTKWKSLIDKTLNSKNPSSEDLRQMYVYHRYFKASKTALLYPGEINEISKGNYHSSQTENHFSEKECSVISIQSNTIIKNWQIEITEMIRNFNP